MAHFYRDVMIGGRHSVCGVPRTLAHTSALSDTERCCVCWDIYLREGRAACADDGVLRTEPGERQNLTQLGRWRTVEIR